jgi:hypothetical protein
MEINWKTYAFHLILHCNSKVTGLEGFKWKGF